MWIGGRERENLLARDVTRPYLGVHGARLPPKPRALVLALGDSLAEEGGELVEVVEEALLVRALREVDGGGIDRPLQLEERALGLGLCSGTASPSPSRGRLGHPNVPAQCGLLLPPCRATEQTRHTESHTERERERNKS